MVWVSLLWGRWNYRHTQCINIQSIVQPKNEIFIGISIVATKGTYMLYFTGIFAWLTSSSSLRKLHARGVSTCSPYSNSAHMTSGSHRLNSRNSLSQSLSTGFGSFENSGSGPRSKDSDMQLRGQLPVRLRYTGSAIREYQVH